jgi:hypothetical protein
MAAPILEIMDSPSYNPQRYENRFFYFHLQVVRISKDSCPVGF